MATLRRDDSDRVIVAIRPHLPPGVQIQRRRSRVLLVKYSPARSERFVARSAPFAHIRGTQSRAGQIGTGLEAALRAITHDLRQLELRWPGLAFGPADVHATADGGSAVATITDVNGDRLMIGPVLAAETAP